MININVPPIPGRDYTYLPCGCTFRAIDTKDNSGSWLKRVRSGKNCALLDGRHYPMRGGWNKPQSWAVVPRLAGLIQDVEEKL